MLIKRPLFETPAGRWSDRTSGVYAYFNDSNKQAEWYWREHYRVWEANRKVFLYPENYIEPELRDDKTPLFKELEDTLLQQVVAVLGRIGQELVGFKIRFDFGLVG